MVFGAECTVVVDRVFVDVSLAGEGSLLSRGEEVEPDEWKKGLAGFLRCDGSPQC